MTTELNYSQQFDGYDGITTCAAAEFAKKDVWIENHEKAANLRKRLWTLERSKDDLAVILSGAGVSCEESVLKRNYDRLAAIIGSWWQEQESIESEPVAKGLLSLAESLQEALHMLSGHRTGFRDRTQIEVTSQVRRFLATDPEIKDTTAGGEFIERFTADAGTLRGHCTAAYADLTKSKGQRRRSALGSYDDFTALLLDLAREAGVKSTIKTDRITGERSGWLLQIAMELETFCRGKCDRQAWKRGRSGSSEARRSSKHVMTKTSWPPTSFCRREGPPAIPYFGGRLIAMAVNAAKGRILAA